MFEEALFISIGKDIQQRLDDFGFLGDAETPVEVDLNTLHSVIKYAINHAHFNGKCVKSRYGFCEEVS